MVLEIRFLVYAFPKTSLKGNGPEREENNCKQYKRRKEGRNAERLSKEKERKNQKGPDKDVALR